LSLRLSYQKNSFNRTYLFAGALHSFVLRSAIDFV